MDTPSTPNLEQLLAHAQWARALARQLVLDEQRADDVVQQAWLAAVERPPAPGPGLRVWFARLIRNVASNQARAERRRMRHEQAAAAPEPAAPQIPAAPEVIDEFAAQQLVAHALLELDEPYRETLLRRWYRDEKPAAIARVMNVPVKTVDTRLARGLERLRAKLTELKGGDARNWALLLVPLAKQAPGAVALVTSGSVVGSLAAGVMAMTMTAKLVVAGVVAVAAVGTWAAVGRERHAAASDRSAAAPVVAARASEAAANDGADRPATAASRSPDAPVAPVAAAPAAPAYDRLGRWRGAWHLHGRVVAKGTHLPIEAIEVAAQVAELGNGNTLATAHTDAKGEFTLERLSKSVRLHFHLDGHLSFDAKFGEAELADAATAPPREFEMEPFTFGTLVCTLQSRDGRPIPPAILAAATVKYGPLEFRDYEHERFDRLPSPIANGPGVEMVIPTERVGDAFRIDHAPAGTPIGVFARLDLSEIGRLRVEPLAPDETREVVVPIQCGIVVTAACVDAATHAPLSMEWAGDFPSIVVRWKGARASDHLEREIEPRALEGALALPGPGRLSFAGQIDGFAPIAFAADVEDGARLAIPLTRWRPLLVKVATADGEPWKRRDLGSQGETPTTHCIGVSFMAAGRAPDCIVVPAGAKLPAELGPDAKRDSRWREKASFEHGHFTILGFEGFAPSQPLHVGVYDEGRLVGSAEVPATAPLLQPDPPAPPPSGKVGAIIPDEPVKPWADRFGPTQTVSVTMTLPPRADGTLRFEAVDADDGKPVPNYEVELTPLVTRAGGELESEMGSTEFKVVDANRGLFTCTAVPAGEWRMRIRRAAGGVDVWSEPITVEAGRMNDLGTLKLAAQGTLAVRVVDEAGAPLADAEVSVRSRDDAEPIAFTLQFRRRLTSSRTDAEGHELRLELPARAVRIEAKSDGYATASADVDVTGTGPASCTITLRRIASNDGASKH